MNAHAMILLIRFLKERSLDHLFCIELFNSQPCEEFFRHMRSMSPTGSSVQEFSLKEATDKVSKIELGYDIMYTKLKDMHFPRTHRLRNFYYDPTGNLTVHPLPDMNEIIKTVESARTEAKEYAGNLGIDAPHELLFQFRTSQNENDYLHDEFDEKHLSEVETSFNSLNISSGIVSDSQQFEDYTASNSNLQTENPEGDRNVLKFFQNIDFEKYSAKNVRKSNSLVDVNQTNGKTITIEKRTLVWLLSKTTTKLQSQRLRRVMMPRFTKSLK